MTNDCSCCKGIEVLTPKTLANRPGLNALVTRVGSHATFLETMKARLSSSDYSILRQLTTRSENDFSIALLDAWATVADVLSFYQERIANEGYLRTATERLSILELARLVGYTLRPGVASSVYLAFTLENGYDVEIPAGTPAQSVPSPGKLLQTFETAEKIESRAAWNSLKPRLTRPHQVEKELNIEATENRRLTASNSSLDSDTNILYFKGISTRLTPNEPLLIDLGDEKPVVYRVMEVKPDSVTSQTAVTLKPWQSELTEKTPTNPPIITSKEGIVNHLLEPLSPKTIPPRNSADLGRDLEATFGEKSETNTGLLTNLHPRLKPLLYQALEKAIVTKATSVKIYALRVQASVFGHNAPPIPILDNGNIIGYEEWPLTEFSRDTEPFEIALKLEQEYQAGGYRTIGTIQIKIDNQSTTIVKRPLQSETFSIDFLAAKETIQVTVEVQNNQIPSFKLKFDFQKRKNQVEITFDEQEKLQVTSSGSNPTTVTRAIAQQVIPRADVDQEVSGVIGSSAANPDGIGADLLVTEIEGQIVQAATSTYYSGDLEIKVSGSLTKRSGPVNTTKPPTEQPNFVSLDAPYGQILPGSWVVVDKLLRS